MFFTSVKVGFFLALRQIRRMSLWTTVLIIFVMTLTFLNLVVVSGILVGLVQGSSEALRTQYSGDLLISNLENKTYVENSLDIIAFAKNMPEVVSLSARYIEGATVEANYKERTDFSDQPNIVGTSAIGIDPVDEDVVTGLSDMLVEGTYLNENEEGQILVGSGLLKKYSEVTPPGFKVLEDAGVGSKVRVKIGGVLKEVTIKGVVKSKVGEVSFRIYFVDKELKKIIRRNDYNVDEIAIVLRHGITPEQAQKIFIDQGFGDSARVQTWQEAQGQFLKDIADTFGVLGNVIGSIGLAVASITIFIVIFINAITRRKYIGILKGIGISSTSIEISYILQSIFYALSGTLIGLVILYGGLKPYFDAHPINFPFSDGILVATISGTMIRVGILMVTTIIAGYVPAKIVIRKNTLDAILGR